MADFPNEGSFWNLLNAGTMGSESTSNSQFPGFSSQAPMTPEQQAFLQSQQQAFLAFQQTFQNIQQNPPQQQSQSSNSIPQQTDSQPKRTRVKHAAKRSKGKEAEPTGDVTTLRWSSDEEALLAECFVAVSEDRNVGRSQAKDTFWIRVMHEFNRKNFQKRTKDMLTSKWTTLNHHCQKFNAIYKRCHRLKKSGESEVDLMGRARGMYQDENKNSSFNHEKAWAILRQHAKWDAPEVAPVDLIEDEPDDFHATAAEKAFEESKDKDETIKSLEELRFLALSTKDLSDDDAYWIERKKAQIKAKLRAEMPMEPNNEDDSDEPVYDRLVYDCGVDVLEGKCFGSFRVYGFCNCSMKGVLEKRRALWGDVSKWGLDEADRIWCVEEIGFGTEWFREGKLCVESKGRRKLFFQLKCEGVVPEIMVYECYFRALCNAGKLDEAEVLLKKMLSGRILPEIICYMDCAKKGRCDDAISSTGGVLRDVLKREKVVNGDGWDESFCDQFLAWMILVSVWNLKVEFANLVPLLFPNVESLPELAESSMDLPDQKAQFLNSI
ncbi:kinase-like domain-containing protein [Tanacetum coccineum]